MVAQLVKSLPPPQLKVDKARLNILNALRAEGKIVAKEFDKTTRTWKGVKPKFEVLIGLDGKDATVVVGPTGSKLAVSKWVWIDQGTRAHRIRAKKAPFLAFRSGFKPKTMPNKITSFPGKSFGSWVFKKEVRHPGTKPRSFTIIVVKRRAEPFRRAMVKAAEV